MNMDNFDHGIWWMHRKLFHRYVKYSKYFRKATEVLPEYQKAILNESKSHSSVTGDKTDKEPTKVSPPVSNIISLITSSSEEVSEEEGGEEDRVSEFFESTCSEPES